MRIFFCQIRRRVGEGGAGRAGVEGREASGGQRGECGGVASPDQDALILIHRQALAVDEFFLEIRQRRIVELKLPLERAIGQAAALAQEGDHLIHNRDKVHLVSSCALLACI